MAKQTENGKAFEYACALAIFNKYKNKQPVLFQKSPQIQTAKKFYEAVTENERNNFNLAANAAIKIIERFEPKLKDHDEEVPLILALQTDSQGEQGDVRDVLCIRKKNGWQIGLSCKHNHHAVKHSRLSSTIDFGEEWFNKKCSKTYFDEVVPIFDELRLMRDESKKTKLWKEIDNKAEKYYIPVLQAFMKELQRLDKKFPKEIPELLIRYLIGRYDFYKVITNDAGRFTRVEVVNIVGTLNTPSKKHKSVVRVPLLKMPTEFYHIGFKEGSSNTIIVACDNGWNVSMRLHNASSKVEPSLKFDVNLIALPNSVYATDEYWDEVEDTSYTCNEAISYMAAEESSLDFSK